MKIAGLEPNLRVTTGPNLAWMDWSICSSSPIELLNLRNLPVMDKAEGPGGSFREGIFGRSDVVEDVSEENAYWDRDEYDVPTFHFGLAVDCQ